MNTLQNLIDHGIEINTAIRMLSEYQKRIGTDNGIYYIKDINYDFNQRGRDVTLECTKCGRVIHRMMISGRNKWSELIKTCDCQKIEKENEKIRVLKNSEKIKKALILLSASVNEIHFWYGYYLELAASITSTTATAAD